MIFIKTFQTAFVCASLCVADISGIITDTGTAPIAGAIVQLENGGQTATTGADGRFTIVVSTAVSHGNAKLLPNGLSARISNNMLTLTVMEQSVVEIETFDLNGKVLSAVKKTFDAGNHSIALRQLSTGLHLYKVKSGNRDFVLKGNTVGRISSGSAILSNVSSSNHIAKQAQIIAEINDVITATKTGYLNYRVVAHNSDTSGIAIKMIASAGTVTDTDGIVYQTVQIGTQVWMAENLRVTHYNDGSLIPLDTLDSTWTLDKTHKFCFYNNTTDPDSIKKYGALYNGYVVDPANPKKLAPAGWHIPSDAEWNTLQNYLIDNKYNWDCTATGNKIAKALAAKTDWRTDSTAGTAGCNLTLNNISGFSALPGGYRNDNGSFSSSGSDGNWWSSSVYDVYNTCYRNIHYDGDYLNMGDYNKLCGFSVRLLKD